MAVQAQYPLPQRVLQEKMMRTGEVTRELIDPYQIMSANNTQKRLREIHQPHNGFSLQHNGFSLHHTLPQSSLTLFSQEEVVHELKKQRVEVDQILNTQGEQLRHMLTEEMRRRYCALFRSAENALAGKQSEIDNAVRRTAELEDCTLRLRAEADTWQTKARSHETAAVTLHAQLLSAEILDVAGEAPAEDAGSDYIDPARVTGECRACRRRFACVVLFPCRHLSVCVPCNDVVSGCPVCLTPINSSVEVCLS